jgi:CSLREA domain-containing protein
MRHRAMLLLLLVALVVAPWTAPARPVHAAGFTANSTADEPDANPGDGVCASRPSGFCTLRAAVMEANALPGPDTITLPAGRYLFNLTGADEAAAATGDLDITDAVTIIGASVATTVVDANRRDRVFEIHNTASVAMSRLTIRGGFAGIGANGPPVLAGGVLNAGALSLTDVWVADNTAFGGIGTPGQESYGGGIVNDGALRLTNVTMSGNTASGKPAGAGALGNRGTAEITNTTISGNQALASNANSNGGGIVNSGTVSLTNVTLSENESVGASFRGHNLTNVGTMRVRNTIVAHTSGRNCSGTIISLGGNLDSGDRCGFLQPSDLNATDPRLASLADNGGQTPTHALLPGSPAVDRAPNAECPATDQRRAPRPRDGNGDGVAICDMGSFEAPAMGDPPPPVDPQPPEPPPPLPPPVVCSPRPPVTVQTSATGDGRLRATLTVSGTNNTLVSLRMGRLDNAQVEVAGQAVPSGGVTVSLPPGTTTTEMLVRPATAGRSVTAQFVVVDRCGEWRSFVGGGPGAF